MFLPQSVEINGLRIDKQYESKGHISKLVKIYVLSRYIPIGSSQIIVYIYS